MEVEACSALLAVLGAFFLIYYFLFWVHQEKILKAAAPVEILVHLFWDFFTERVGMSQLVEALFLLKEIIFEVVVVKVKVERF
jgi:hypothetical protein